MSDVNTEQIHIFYEIAMSIGRSLDLEDMLKQSVSVFLKKLDCYAGGVNLYVTPGHLQPKLRTFMIPRIFAGTEEYSRISEIIDHSIEKRISSNDEELFPPKQFRSNDSYNLIIEMPETGFVFLSNKNSDFDSDLIKTLQELVARLSAACIACYQNDALIQSQYDLELRIAHRTKELEDRNNELKIAYDNLQKAQRQLIHSEKMISLGQLAAGVAHEINNPTGFISSNLDTMTEYLEVFVSFYNLSMELIEKAFPDGTEAVNKKIEEIQALRKDEDIDFLIDDSKQLLVESIDGANRIKGIVTGLRKFGRSDNSDFKMGNINVAIEDALKLTWNELKYKCEVEKKLGQLKDIPCKEDQLTQVFVNILVNASQAIEAHGKIAIESYIEDRFIVVKISDSGTGIPEDILPKLFDPFFTTKETGKGTGLGLSISHGIIEKHGGTIGAESTPGEGTTFTIKLPTV